MKDLWKFEDIIDLEYFIGLDLFQADSEEKLHLRERRIFLEAKKNGELEVATHHQSLAAWLANRRSAELQADHPFLPGQKLRGAIQLFTLLLFAAGLIIGFGMGISYFAYTGSTPLNVFTFFIVFLLPQLFLIVLFFLKNIAAQLLRKPRANLRIILRPLFTRFVRFIKKRVFGNLKEDQQKSFNQLFSEKNSRLFSRPLFVRGQLFGVSFNIGLLAVTLFKITTTDLAFGWQTTLQLGAEKLHSLVKFLALPWSWFLPAELASPSLAQIEGSRIILKEGIYHLLTEDLTSWWPFLLMSLLCYGLLPRVLLFFCGAFMEKRNIIRLLRQRKFLAISSRMRTPLVTSQAAEEHSRASAPSEHPQQSPQPAGNRRQPEDAVVLVPDEAAEFFSKDGLEQLLLPYGYHPVKRKIILKTYEDDQAIISDIAREETPVIVLFEAWMAPIREHLLFLEKISHSLHGKTPLAVCLLGKPGKDGVLIPPRRQEILLWREKISECCDVAAIFQSGEHLEDIEEQQT
mgnify:CR=1 FL=1